MAKRKRKNKDLKNIQIKLQIESHEPHEKLKCSGRVSSSCPTSGTRPVNLVANPVIRHE